MAVERTSSDGLGKTINSTGFAVAGGSTTIKTLTVSENSTIDQDLQKSAKPTFAGVTIDAVAIENIETTISDVDTALPTSGAVIDRIASDVAAAGGLTPTEVTADVTPGVIGKEYIANKAGTVCTISLPATAGQGGKMGGTYKGATGFKFVAAAGDTIQLPAKITKAGGYIQSVDAGCSIVLECITADSVWIGKEVNGNYDVEVS